MNTVIQIGIKNGTLNVEELKNLAQCLATIQQKDPNRHLDIWINAPDLTLQDMAEVQETAPGLKFRGVTRDGVV